MIDESLRQQLATRVARLEQQIRAFKELHATELGLILDELARLRTDLDAMAPAKDEPTGETAAATSLTVADPAAASPKRAKWLAEEARREAERKAPLSRRELLRGREREET